MGNLKKHRILLSTGSILWCISFFGEAFTCQPYSTIGLIISPVVTAIGLIYWYKFYISTRGHSPRFISIIKDNTVNIGGKFTLRSSFLFSHILEFWTFCVLFWMALVLVIMLPFRSSGAFQATKNYCQNKEHILLKTGTIKYYGVLVGGSISLSENEGKTDISFTIVGTNGNFNARSILTKLNGVWTVDDLELK